MEAALALRRAPWLRLALVVSVATAQGACRGGVRRAGAPRAAPPATPPAASPGLAWDARPRRDPGARVEGLPELARVDEGLWRSAQPTTEGYRAARAMGIRTIVDLRGSKVGPEAAAAAGLRHVALRTSVRRIDEDVLVAFLRAATDPEARPVLVHCASGHDRTGVAVAAYRRVAHGWSADEALREMRRFGASPFEPRLERLVERLRPDDLAARAAVR